MNWKLASHRTRRATIDAQAYDTKRQGIEMMTLHAMSKIDAHGTRSSDMFTCPICGRPKTHYRLYGYRCSVNPEHDGMANSMSERELEAARDKWKGLK